MFLRICGLLLHPWTETWKSQWTNHSALTSTASFGIESKSLHRKATIWTGNYVQKILEQETHLVLSNIHGLVLFQQHIGEYASRHPQTQITESCFWSVDLCFIVHTFVAMYICIYIYIHIHMYMLLKHMRTVFMYPIFPSSLCNKHIIHSIHYINDLYLYRWTYDPTLFFPYFHEFHISILTLWLWLT